MSWKNVFLFIVRKLIFVFFWFLLILYLFLVWNKKLYTKKLNKKDILPTRLECEGVCVLLRNICKLIKQQTLTDKPLKLNICLK